MINPTFLWWKFDAGTASTDTNNLNTVSVNGTFSRAWDFSGNARHSQTNINTPLWESNILGTYSAIRSNLSNIGYLEYRDDSFVGASNSYTIIKASKGYTQSTLWNTVNTSGSNFYVNATSSVNVNAYLGVNYFLDELMLIQDSTNRLSINGLKNIHISGTTFSSTEGTLFYCGTSSTIESSYRGTYSFVQDVSPPNYPIWGLVTTCEVSSTHIDYPTHILEYMIWDTYLTSSEIDEVVNYLKNKWGF